MSPSIKTRKNFNSVFPERERMIAEAAYYYAEKRGFEDGEEARLQDWLAAEREIDALLQEIPVSE
jgi:hypothetical protein